MLALRIAFRYLRAKKSHRAVNVITSIAVTGVAIATMAMVLVLCIFNGFTDLALSQLSNLDPDLAVVPTNGKVIGSADSLAAVIADIPGVEAALPVVSERALVADGDARIPVIIKGVPDEYARMSNIENIIIAGEYAPRTTTGVPAAQLSVGVANRIHSFPSAQSDIRFYVPRRSGRVNPANPAAAFRSEEFVFSGVFRVNNPDVDNDNVIVPLEAARNLLDFTDEASVIEVFTAPATSPEKVKKLVDDRLGPGKFLVLDRLQQRADSFRMISVEKWVTFMMLVCILVIALFNVVSTLSLLAIEKRDNMWTLKALGAPASMVRNIFISEGFLVTVLGGIIGIAAGILIALAQQFFHIVRLSGDVSALSINYYPVRVEFSDILAVAAVILVMAVVISVIARLIVRSDD